MKYNKHITFDFKVKEKIIKALLYRGDDQQRLFKYAQQVRDEVFAKKIEVRSVIEYSNVCQQACNYCGMNRHSRLRRYILNDNAFLRRMEKLYQIGVEIATEQCIDLLQKGAPGIHFYTLNKSMATIDIFSSLPVGLT